MNHDEVAASGDEILNLSDLSRRAVVAADDCVLCSGSLENFTECCHNACPVSILERLNSYAELLALEDGQVSFRVELWGSLDAFGFAGIGGHCADGEREDECETEQCYKLLHYYIHLL